MHPGTRVRFNYQVDDLQRQTILNSLLNEEGEIVGRCPKSGNYRVLVNFRDMKKVVLASSEYLVRID